MADGRRYRLCGACGRREFDLASSEGDPCGGQEPGGSECRGVLGMPWFISDLVRGTSTAAAETETGS